MAAHSLQVTMRIRHDTQENWQRVNPILSEGEYGLEDGHFLLKIGDGYTNWNDLPYLNKLNSKYFTRLEDGSLTFSQTFLDGLGDLLNLQINEPPVQDNDIPNKKYVDDAIAAAGHLRREVVTELPLTTEADEDIIYMIQSGTHYDEYMIINGVWDIVGTTGDGVAYTLPVATTTVLGGVKASVEDDYVNVTQEGFMTLNRVSTSKLYVPVGDTLILNGGTAG